MVGYIKRRGKEGANYIIITATVSLVSAFGAVFLTNYLNYKRNLNDWYFDKYISNGINGVMIDIAVYKSQASMYEANIQGNINSEILFSVDDLLGGNEMTEFIQQLHLVRLHESKPLRNEQFRKHIFIVCDSLMIEMRQLRSF